MMATADSDPTTSVRLNQKFEQFVAYIKCEESNLAEEFLQAKHLASQALSQCQEAEAQVADLKAVVAMAAREVKGPSLERLARCSIAPRAVHPRPT